MAANHTTKGKIINVTMLVTIVGTLIYMATTWKNDERQLEYTATGPYAYYVPFKTATMHDETMQAYTTKKRQQAFRPQDIEPAAGGQ